MRSLWPREHGAYAQLLVPLLTALVLAPSRAGALIGAGACLAFLANEPLLVLLGHRGARLRDALGGRAARRLAFTIAGAALAGGAGLVLATATTRWFAGLVAIPALLMIVLAWRRAAHSLVGELVAAIVLPGASAPVVVAGGASGQHALALWLAWSAGYAMSVVAVQHVIARRRGPTPDDHVRLVTLVVGTIATLACARIFPTLLVATPLAAAAAVVGLWSPSPRYLKTIGVVLVGVSLVCSVVAFVVR